MERATSHLTAHPEPIKHSHASGLCCPGMPSPLIFFIHEMHLTAHTSVGKASLTIFSFSAALGTFHPFYKQEGLAPFITALSSCSHAEFPCYTESSFEKGPNLTKGRMPCFYNLQSTFLTVIFLFVLFPHFTDEATSAQRGQNSGPTKVTRPVKGEVETDSQAFG